MNILTFKKSISSLVMVTFATMTTLAPAGQALATPVCDSSNATTAAGGTKGCAVKKFPAGAYAYAKLDWTRVGSLDYKPTSGISMTMASGDSVLSSNNRTAAALGLKANQVANVMTLFPTNVPFVFARYNAASAELRVDIFKIEKANGQMRMMQAPFTPAHGGAYAAAMTYATASERAHGFSPGANPFALYLVPGDDAFHNVGSQALVQVAVGHAMQMAGASIGLVAMPKTRVDQYTTSSGSWFKKTTTTHVDGHTKPLWYVATPASFQSHGDSYQVCAQDFGPDPTKCPKALLVPSGVAWSQWEGGSLPAFETITSTYEHSKSSFTLMAWVAVAFLVVVTAGAFAVAAAAGAGTVLGPAAAAWAAAGTLVPELVTIELSAAALTATGVLSAAAVEAAAVAVVGSAVGLGSSGNASGPVAAQYQGATSAYAPPVIPDSVEGRSIYDGVHREFDNKPLGESGIAAVNVGLFGEKSPGVACALDAPSAGCASSGLVPRVESGAETNNVQFWQDNGRPMVISDPFLH